MFQPLTLRVNLQFWSVEEQEEGSGLFNSEKKVIAERIHTKKTTANDLMDDD